jgi:hypothetical protein
MEASAAAASPLGIVVERTRESPGSNLPILAVATEIGTRTSNSDTNSANARPISGQLVKVLNENTTPR